MPRHQDPRKAMLSVMFMFIILLSYGPVKHEISDLAENVTTDNPVISFLDSWFGIFWALLAIFFIAMAIYQVVQNM